MILTTEDIKERSEKEATTSTACWLVMLMLMLQLNIKHSQITQANILHVRYFHVSLCSFRFHCYFKWHALLLVCAQHSMWHQYNRTESSFVKIQLLFSPKQTHKCENSFGTVQAKEMNVYCTILCHEENAQIHTCNKHTATASHKPNQRHQATKRIKNKIKEKKSK